MRTFVEAATGLPTILFTSALVVVVCFWLLVALGVAEVDSFDGDVDLDAWGLGGVPVSVAFSLLIAAAWTLSTGGTIMAGAIVPSGVLAGVLRLAVPVGALSAAWWLIGRSIRALHRFCSDQRGSSRPAEGIGGVTGSAPILRDEDDVSFRFVPPTTPEELPQARDRAS